MAGRGRHRPYHRKGGADALRLPHLLLVVTGRRDPVVLTERPRSKGAQAGAIEVDAVGAERGRQRRLRVQQHARSRRVAAVDRMPGESRIRAIIETAGTPLHQSYSSVQHRIETGPEGWRVLWLRGD